MHRYLLLPLVLLSGAAAARTLSVGPNQPFLLPSAAAHAAQDGDTVLIEPGEYYDCAVWTQNHLVIAGARPGVVITDTTCQGKALFVVTGDDTTIRDLTLARARVPDRNGAGIREEGQGLILRRVQFVDNQVGLLNGSAGAGEITISDCGFEGGGIGGERPDVRGACRCREPVADRRFDLQAREGRPDKHLGGSDGTLRQSDRDGNGRGARGGDFECEQSFGHGGQRPVHWAALTRLERRGAGHGARTLPSCGVIGC